MNVLISILLLVFVSCLGNKVSVERLQNSPFRLSDGVTTIATDMYQVLAAESEGGNIIFSPFSVHAALSMVLLGAPNGTTTHEELVSVLGMDPKHTSDYYWNYLRLILYYRTGILGKTAAKVKVANAVFADDTVKTKTDFDLGLQLFFQSRLHQVDFAQAQEAADQMNELVQQATNGLIQQVADPSSLDDLTRLMIINVIYFKANWQSRFDIANTRPLEFNVDKDNSYMYEHFMSQREANFRLADMSEELGAKVLELPYENNLFRMLVILPNKDRDVRQVGDALPALDWDLLEGRLFSRLVSLWMPRFNATFEAELVDTLKILGVNDAFDEAKAELTDLAEGEELVISGVLHKAKIEVNEEGSEAAAVTTIQLTTRTGSRSGIQFVVDRPFIYVIQDTIHNIPLFVGRVVDPSGVRTLSTPDFAIRQDTSSSFDEEKEVKCDEELGYEVSQPDGVSLPCNGQDTLALRQREEAENKMKINKKEQEEGKESNNDREERVVGIFETVVKKLAGFSF